MAAAKDRATVRPRVKRKGLGGGWEALPGVGTLPWNDREARKAVLGKSGCTA